jgi:predicted DNA-binding transcriptional regulator AlpA
LWPPEYIARVDSRTREDNATEEFAMTAARRQEAGTEGGAPDKSGPRRMLNEAQVLALIPVSRTTLHRMTKAGRFPKGTYVSANRRLWFADEIETWQAAVDEFDPNRGRGNGRRRRVSAK